jgi:hypothetical protein
MKSSQADALGAYIAASIADLATAPTRLGAVKTEDNPIRSTLDELGV